MAPWTLHDEICQAAGEVELPAAIDRLNLASTRGRGDLSCEVVQDWHRAGAESYALRFNLTGSGGILAQLIMKAVVPSSPVIRPEEYLAELVRRRGLLVANGVAAPHLYYWGRGLLIEEYVPLRLDRWLTSNPSRRSRALFGQVSRYATRLDALGFCPISPFVDLRTDGDVVYAVDFGEDIGPPHVRSPSDKVALACLDWIASFSGDEHQEVTVASAARATLETEQEQ